MAAAVAAAALAGPSASSGTVSASTAAATARRPLPPRTLEARAAQAPQGLGPAQIRSTYALPPRGTRGQTIAIVSPYDDPSIQADLSAYSQRFVLPPCTEQNRCLRKLNENGSRSPLPPKDLTGGMWITESALGIEVAHGVCESCSLLLVEATTDTKRDLAAAVSAAARAGATVIVTAYTAPEDPNDASYVDDFSPSRAAVVTAVGDTGYTGSAHFPSSLPNVLAVGGTQLRFGAGGRSDGEQAWSQTTSGCSLYQSVPSWQVRIAPVSGCGTQRAVADLAAAADPGAIVHITGAGQAGGPWYVASGTSLSAPIIAGVIGLAGSVGSREAQMLYARAQSDPGAFHDIRTGTDATGCTVTICRAARGWDGPTGLGTPNGLAAFLPSGGALDPRRPAISVSATGNRLHVNSRSTTQLRLRNNNPFAISGTIGIRRTLRIGGRLRPVQFGSGKLTLGPLGSGTHSVAIAKRYLGRLKALGNGTVYVQLRVHGPAGRSVTVTKSLPLYAP
ncbi:MAG: S8 family serine peptidase [Solirubrobacteraceae bacterium]